MGKKNQKNHEKQGKNHQKSHGRHKIAKEPAVKKDRHSSAPSMPKNMSNLFKIVPEHDDFAALGYDHEEEGVAEEEEDPQQYGGEESSQSYQDHLQQEE